MSRAIVTDATWIRARDRRLVIAGSPASLFKVASAAASVLDDPESAEGETAEAVVGRLVRAGALHRVATEPADPARVVVAVPARVDDAEGLARLGALVEGLAPLRTLVVDDASSVDLAAALEGHRHCTVRTHDDNRGPAAARNTALAAITDDHGLAADTVVFVDADVSASPTVLLALAGHLGRDGTALAAPRVVAERVDHWLGRFEAHEGALDMGPERARVKPGSRVPYVPTATVAVDVAAAREAGGFDESLRTGEDVDFVRRLGAAGHGCLYDPTLRVGHLPRRGVAAVARRRFAYGASAGPLAVRHGGLVAPLRAAGSGARVALAGWALLLASALWWPLVLVGAAGLLASTVAGSRALVRAGVDAPTAVRVAVGAVLAAGRRAGIALTRTWWPLSAAAAIAVPRLGIAIAAVFVALTMRDWWVRSPGSGRRLDPVRFLVARAIDHLAHGAGLWWGAARAQRLAPLVPAVSR